MVIVFAVLAAIGFIVWAIIRAVKNKGGKAHSVSYGIAIVAAIFTYGYFLNMDIPQFVKIVGSIILGVILIIAAAIYQRRKTAEQGK